MKRLITPDDIVAMLGGVASSYDPFIETSQAIVESYIQASLQQRTVALEKHMILYDLDPEECIVFRDGPVASLLSFEIDGTAVELDSSGTNEDTIVKPWILKYLRGIRKDRAVKLSFVAGYTAETLPSQLKAALINTTALVQKNPTMTELSESIGDYSITYGGGASGGSEGYALNARICSLLTEFKRPRL